MVVTDEPARISECDVGWTVTGSARAAMGTLATGALAMALLIAAAPAVADEPVYVRPFSHWENIAAPEDGADIMRRQMAIIDKLDVRVELNFHRGEFQAAWMAIHAPDVVSKIKQHRYEVAYHPHPVRPFTDIVAGMSNMSWDDAVAAYTDLERCAVDYATAEVDCSRPGGAEVVKSVFGKPLVGVANGGPDAVATYVYKHVLGIPTQLDSGTASYDDIFGDAYMYWYMGQLVFKNPGFARWKVFAERPVGPAVAALPGEGPHLLSVVVSDKLWNTTINEQIDAAWYQGATLASVAPTNRSPVGKVNAWLDRYERVLRDLKGQAKRSGGGYLHTSEVLALVHPVEETLSAAELHTAAEAYLAQTAQRPPLGVSAGPGKVISLTDLYEGLVKSLAAYRETGAVPAQVTTTGLLGPIGDRAVPGGAGQGTLAASDLLVALPQLTDRVPIRVDVGGAGGSIYATEMLWLLSRLYVQVRDGTPDAALQRSSSVLRLEPQGSPIPTQRSDTAKRGSRFDGYTVLQYWTAKPVRWR